MSKALESYSDPNPFSKTVTAKPRHAWHGSSIGWCSMSKQIGHVTASVIDKICFADKDGISTLVITGSGAQFFLDHMNHAIKRVYT